MNAYERKLIERISEKRFKFPHNNVSDERYIHESNNNINLYFSLIFTTKIYTFFFNKLYFTGNSYRILKNTKSS